ncbi:hypothetical protein M404DRAFT_1002927 [Pisolithus tinctorius Marx 270]|uniref:Uncharacterized protein n=1 Tax=Pisolithus tinctorius Marx 270 TaxID=870435 RepID=A0A0C3IXD5_PISTI|nr:hypothetical protein M404DRAFT_1002927 [Pisolithus tinctorius Marx 270]
MGSCLSAGSDSHAQRSFSCLCPLPDLNASLFYLTKHLSLELRLFPSRLACPCGERHNGWSSSNGSNGWG